MSYLGAAVLRLSCRLQIFQLILNLIKLKIMSGEKKGIVIRSYHVSHLKFSIASKCESLLISVIFCKKRNNDIRIKKISTIHWCLPFHNLPLLPLT